MQFSNVVVIPPSKGTLDERHESCDHPESTKLHSVDVHQASQRRCALNAKRIPRDDDPLLGIRGSIESGFE